jgi:hypothetical protein
MRRHHWNQRSRAQSKMRLPMRFVYRSACLQWLTKLHEGLQTSAPTGCA